VAQHSHPDVIKMKVLCAWCCREGLPGYMGEHEPLDDPQPTHGICALHQAQILESQPSQSYPDAEMLIVVRQSNPALYERLRGSFAAMSGVEVIVDRRVSDRRASPSPESDKRRHVRTRRIREGAISPLDEVMVLRFTPKAAPAPASELASEVTEQAS
jgi:hypothetical protein